MTDGNCNLNGNCYLNVTINKTVGVYSGSAGVLGRCGDLPVFLLPWICKVLLLKMDFSLVQRQQVI